MNKKGLILLSGGLDSSTAFLWAISKGYELTALSINYHLRPQKERDACIKLCNDFKVENIIVDMPFIKEIDDLHHENYEITKIKSIPDGYIPMKNLLFYSLGAYFCEIHQIFHLISGQIKTDEKIYPDASMDYFSTLENQISQGGASFQNGNFELIFPLKDLEKGDVVNLAKDLKLSFEHTWSCYENFDQPCGECKGCVERRNAFLKVGFEDPFCCL